MKTPRGFTLLEMLIVLAILGLAMGITAGFVVRPNTEATLANATARVEAELRLARMRAMSESRPVRVTLNGDGFALDGLRLPATLSMAGPTVIVFAPDGSTTGGAVLVRVGGREARIQVDWLTGRVSLAAPKRQ